MNQPVSYGPTKLVEPIEKKYIIGYTNKLGQDYVGVAPDFEKEPWFNELIQKYGLENLCKKYPYQPLKVDKETALLVPALNNFSNPLAKLTNCFHVIYHMRKDKQNEQNSLYGRLVEQPSIGIQETNLRANLENISSESKGVTPNWSSAYHHEIEIPKIHDVCVNNFIENEEDDKNKHAIQNVDASINTNTDNIPKGWHPNDRPQMDYSQQYYQNNSTVSNTQPNPYTYNPAYGMSTYLPQYKTTGSIEYPFLSVPGNTSYDMFEDAMRKRAETEQANLEYATKMNLNIKQSNPTMLDTSNTIDFSNPESVAKMQGMYANPYYNNLNNPNFMTQPQTPYSMSNPYGGVVNPLYGNYNPGYGYGAGGWWNNNNIDLGFMDFNEDEMRLGKGFSVKLVRGNKVENQSETKVNPKQSKSNKIQVKLIRVVQAVKEGKVVEIPKEDYEKSKNELKDEDDFDIQMAPDRKKKAYTWYGEEYKKQVMKLAKEIAEYDEARALCLVGSLDDASISKQDFRHYYDACNDKLSWFRVQEQAHPDKDYRVPFRYRKTPVPKRGIDGKLLFESYTIPMKRFITLPSNESIQFYEYDRGREPDEDEWTLFYEQAEYIRDQEIQIKKAKEIEEYEKEQQELYRYNPYNSMEYRLHELKVEERMRRNQYDVFRSAYASTVSDQQFDQWWYRGNYASMPNRPRTDEELLEQRKQWRYNMGLQHYQILSTFQPLDHEKIKQEKTRKINQLVYEFDRGTMEGCKDLKDFFDRLGYLSVRLCEENIARQRAQDLNASLTVNRYDYNQQLYQTANYSPFGVGVNDPYYQNRPHYMDFVNSQEYDDRKKEFFNYCSTSQGSIPLRPVYK